MTRSPFHSAMQALRPRGGHLLTRKSDLAVDDEVRFLLSLPYISPLHDIRIAYIALLADLRSVGLHCFFRIEHRRQQLILYFHEFQGGFRNVLTDGRHRRHVVSVETGCAVQNLAAVVEPGVLPHMLRRIEMGDYAYHTWKRFRLAGVDSNDAGMRMGTSQDLAVHHSLYFHVDGVLERSGDFLLGVLDRNTLAGDSERGTMSCSGR